MTYYAKNTAKNAVNYQYSAKRLTCTSCKFLRRRGLRASERLG